jgi:hypothetical protein
MKLTRHAEMSLYDIGEVPEDQIVELEDELSDYLWTLIGDFKETYSPFAHRCQTALYEYFYEIDPIGIRDNDAGSSNEYYFEASAIFWLLKTERLNEKAIWAIWIFYFDRELSPYKDEFHPQIKEIFEKEKDIYKNASSDPLL